MTGAEEKVIVLPTDQADRLLEDTTSDGAPRLEIDRVRALTPGCLRIEDTGDHEAAHLPTTVAVHVHLRFKGEPMALASITDDALPRDDFLPDATIAFGRPLLRGGLGLHTARASLGMHPEGEVTHDGPGILRQAIKNLV
ncbi:hypothetical protein N7462_000257 [Penicillium macrosclerotiorum]|uniref:uncharacterized protein n=1 Tax=Penicillium macrosclerotiorum TaxID=303699 RepID=UPI002548B585|nr:uncharacterized protein N7462_000257 [Penicillium macrosclerotiorum]KAJ5698252.1 hypothetical protein N7462_000257 [Penicillium macrosclerotiorum]